MKKQLLLLAALCLATAQAWGQEVVTSGTCGAEGDGSNLTWTLTADSTLTISGTGAMAGYVNQNYQPWYEYQGSIKVCTIADGVTSIGRCAFMRCPALASVAIGEDVTNIEYAAFASCPALTSVTFPDGMASIGDFAFENCTALASVTLPGMADIGVYAFSYCESLTSVTIPDGVTNIGDYAFCSCTSLASVIVGSGVTSIGNNTFYGCTSLTSVTIPDGVESIGDYAFRDCTSLASVTIGNGVTSIGFGAFAYCTTLASVAIGNGVTSIGDYAFGGGTALDSLTCRAAVPPAVEYGTFNKVDKSIPVYVPAGSIEAYRTTEYWDEFTNYLPLPDVTTGIAAPSLAKSITVKDGEVHINIIGMDEVQVYDLQGRHVLSTTERCFTLPQGVYIIKVGDEAIPLIP